MNILHKVIIVYYGNPYGHKSGVDRASSTLIEELTKNNISCYTAYCYACENDESLLYTAGELKMPSVRISHRDNVIALVKYIKDNGINIIINQGGIFYEVTKLCVCASKYTKAPLITVVHSSPRRYITSRSDKYKRLITDKELSLKPVILLSLVWYYILYLRAYIKTVRILRYAYGNSTKLVLLSHSLLEETKNIAHIKDQNKRLLAIPNAIAYEKEGERVSVSNKGQKILFVGRLDNVSKRVDLLLKIWKTIQERLPEWSLHILGEGKDGEVLQERAKALRLKNLYFEGYVEPKKWYESSAILCMTSAFEGFPLALIEAQYYGVVPIAFASFSSVFDIICDGENGFLVEPYDVDEFANKLEQLSSDNELRNAMASKAMATSRMYSRGGLAKQWIALITKIGK